MSKKYRSVKTFKHYFEEFFVRQDQNVKDKIIWTLELIEDLEIVPSSYLKQVKEVIYEIRIKHGRNIWRIFCFFSSENQIVLLNGFQKKTQKTPKTKILRALAIKQEYDNED